MPEANRYENGNPLLQRIELKCYASGYPPPEIYWRRQDNAILPTNTSVFKGNVLVFPSVRKEHRGTYYCVATNVVGRGSRRNVDVEVEFAPQIKVSEGLCFGIMRREANGS